MMYFLYKLVCFRIYIIRFFMYILTELKRYFVIEDQTIPFLALFQVRSEAFMEMWRGGTEKQGFYPDPLNSDRVSLLHQHPIRHQCLHKHGDFINHHRYQIIKKTLLLFRIEPFLIYLKNL